jgi:hypothetical protein
MFILRDAQTNSYALRQNLEERKMTSTSAEISPETAQILIAQARAAHLSVEEYLRRLLGIAVNGKTLNREPTLDEFTQALNEFAEDVQPPPRNFSREDIYFPNE